MIGAIRYSTRSDALRSEAMLYVAQAIDKNADRGHSVSTIVGFNDGSGTKAKVIEKLDKAIELRLSDLV